MPEPAPTRRESSKPVPVGEPPTPEGWTRYIVLSSYAYEGWSSAGADGEDNDPLPTYATRAEATEAARSLGLISPKGKRDDAEVLAVRVFPVGEPDDERLVEKVAELMRRQEGEHRSVQWNLPVYRKRARAVVAAVRAAGPEPDLRDLLREAWGFDDRPTPADGEMADAEVWAEQEAWQTRWDDLDRRIQAALHGGKGRKR